MSSTVLHDSRGPEAILQELSGVIVESQSALLQSKPQELENCILRQRALCEKLESSLRDASLVPACVGAKTAPTDLVLTAMKAREQNRLFSGLLRRMRHNLEIMRNTLLGPSLEYSTRQPAGGARKT